MARKIFYLVVGVLFGALTACHKEEEIPPQLPPQPRAEVDRTVLAYIVGDNVNSVSELTSLLLENFYDMKKGMERVDYSKYNLVVYSETKYDVPRLISLKHQNGSVVADTLFTYQEQNPLNKQVMSSVISQVVHYFPAKSYGFVFLSHAESWVPAVSDANTRSLGDYRGFQMNISDFREALHAFPVPLKFILFDACFMQSVEVAYELRDCAEYLIGSPTEIPGPGAPYDELVQFMFAEVDPARKMAKAYFQEYERRYNGGFNFTDYNWTAGVSVASVRSGALVELAQVTNRILSKTDCSIGEFTKQGIQRYDWGSRDANYDLYGFVSSVAGESSVDFQQWKRVYDEVIDFWATTAMNYSVRKGGMFPMDKAHGVSVYIPSGNASSDLNNYYRCLDWYSAVGWDKKNW